MTKILVIEDADHLRKDIIDILYYEGFEVFGAEDGKKGIELALQHRPDLIVCDIMMPGLLGYDVLKILREDKVMATVPFIFLTAKIDREDVRQGMGMGADDYLTKPFGTNELLQTIQARLEKRERINAETDARINELTENIITALPHELRTPLNTIIGFSDMFIMDSEMITPEQIAEWARHINIAGHRLSRLVENYLAYVRVEVMLRDGTRQVAAKMRYSFPDVTVPFHAASKAEAHQRAGDLVCDVEGGCKLPISEQDLGKMIDELADNAFKFSQPGQKVMISGAIEGAHYVVNVTDHGRGMKTEHIDAIGPHMQFERWFYEHQGTGLGLAIARGMARLYGGKLSITSAENAGTSVTVRLPVE